MGKTKFYHYDIWCESEDGKRLNLNDVLEGDTFIDGLSMVPIAVDNNYHIEFQLVETSKFHGRITRTKDESQYIRRNNRYEIALLSDEIDNEGETGSINRDHVNLAVVLDGKRLKLLIEKGFQTPGVKVFESYLRQNADDQVDSIKHKSAVPDLDEDEVDDLLSSELKKSKVSFKKYPEMLENSDEEETLSQIIPDDYRLTFEANLESRDDAKEKDVGDFLDSLFSKLSTNHDTVEQTITQIDFPSIMHTFTVVGMDGDKEIEENFAKVINKVEIDTSKYGLFDIDLGRKLCDEIDNREH